MSQHIERRDHLRMTMACNMHILGKQNRTRETVYLDDLSAAGMRFVSSQEFTHDSSIDIEIQPLNELTPPLQAKINVLRCKPFSGRDLFEVAATISEITPVSKAAFAAH